MTNNLNIDVSKGKLDQKEKGSLLPIECKSIEETRRYNLERLASGFRMFAHFGFDEGIAGHITYRDPEHEDHFWVNPFGMHFNQICVSDLILVNHDGEVIQGDKAVNVAAFAIHSRLHKARPDVNAAAHSQRCGHRKSAAWTTAWRGTAVTWTAAGAALAARSGAPPSSAA